MSNKHSVFSTPHQFFEKFIKMINSRFFCWFLLINTTKHVKGEVKMVNYLCVVTEKILTTDSDTKDVTIATFNNHQSLELLDEVTSCISKHSMVIVTDFSKRIQDIKLKANLIIFLLDDLNQVSLDILLLWESTTTKLYN